MNITFDDTTLGSILRQLGLANARAAAAFPGDSSDRQPVHTVYGGAHLFRADSGPALGRKALEALGKYGPDAASFAAAIGIPDESARTVYDRMTAKLRNEPVEDYRIDFEDGYGYRPAHEEDEQAVRTAGEVAAGMKRGSLPPFIGIRIKPLTEALSARAIRTLDIFLTTLLERSGGELPHRFAVTLPKITVKEQVSTLADVFDLFESRKGLRAGSLRMELMIETPQSVIDASGRFALPGLVEAARGRCRGAHFGAYDYTALCNITASQQDMLHPACDFARQAMLVCLAQRGIFISDGATNIIPISRAGDAAAVHRAWRLHASHARHSLVRGIYQGWDLHPAQLPSRYATVYSFFHEGLAEATSRLKNFIEQAAQATIASDVFDDAATGQGLLNYFLRGLGCGALSESDVLAAGLSIDELRTRSFLNIVETRRTARALDP